MEKTLVIWSDTDNNHHPQYFILDGDYRILDGVYINAWFSEEDDEQEKQYRLQRWLDELVFYDNGSYRVVMYNHFNELPEGAVSNYVIQSGRFWTRAA